MFGVNASDVVVGTRVESYGDPQFNNFNVPFTWDEPSNSITTSLVKNGTTTASAINDSGVVAGNVPIPGSQNFSAYIRLADGTVTPFTVGTVGTWEKIKKIRMIRDDLIEVGATGMAAEEMNERVTTTIEEIVEESTQVVLAGHKGEEGRKNELKTAVPTDVRRLFGQIERGLTN